MAFIKRGALFVLLLLASCRDKQADMIISIDHAHNIIKATGLPEITLNGIQRDSMSIEAWQNLYPVFKMPADTDMREFQPAIKGKYNIIGQAIAFKPDTPFKAGQVYFARYYRYDKKVNLFDMILHKRPPGKATYTELIFKY